ncbi:MAG: hypothetical protein FDX30_01580 [Chlorobium sp.]|nr:MAG: hypothetical protein FDX30_01580 [Chlorobium sp.]
MDSERLSWLLSRLELYAQNEQRCDITLFSDKPKIDVKIDPKFSFALMYGGGVKAIKPLLEKLQLSDGSCVNAFDIWTINQMPEKGFKPDELEAVDLKDGDQEVQGTGKTIREIIRETYKCENKSEEEKFLCRFLAS